MFKKIFKFIAGYVIIEVAGKNKERFLNLCLSNDIAIWNVHPNGNVMIVSMSNQDFMKIRKLRRVCRVKIKLLEKKGGIFFLKKYRHRYGFLAAGILVCIYFVLVPQYIWCVEIVGAKNADVEKIEKILRDNGVFVGAKKNGIADLGDLKNAVIGGEEEVNWAWLYIDGAKARLVLQERTRPPQVADKKEPTDIIAVCDGIVEKADIKRGERRVNAGDTVTEGQLLVSGKVAVFREGYDEKYSYVHSDAKIIADTIRTETGEFNSKETLRIKTGNKKRQFLIQIFGREFKLGKSADEVFEDYDTAEKFYDARLPYVGYLGFGMSVKTAYEVNKIEHKLTEKEVLIRAEENLRERIAKKLGIGASMTDKMLTYKKDGDKYTVKLTMRLRENIGMEIPCKE